MTYLPSLSPSSSISSFQSGLEAESGRERAINGGGGEQGGGDAACDYAIDDFLFNKHHTKNYYYDTLSPTTQVKDDADERARADVDMRGGGLTLQKEPVSISDLYSDFTDFDSTSEFSSVWEGKA